MSLKQSWYEYGQQLGMSINQLQRFRELMKKELADVESAGVWKKATEGCFPNTEGSYYLREPLPFGGYHKWSTYVVPNAINILLWREEKWEWLDESQSAAAPSLKEREMAISFLDNIKDYERESGNQICYDERTSEELFDLYLESLNKKP